MNEEKIKKRLELQKFMEKTQKSKQFNMVTLFQYIQSMLIEKNIMFLIMNNYLMNIIED